MATLISGLACVDPLRHYRECLSRGLPTLFWGQANAFQTALGVDPGRGKILLTFEVLSNLDLTNDQTLTFSGTASQQVYTLKSITLIGSECISPGGESDPAAVFLCDVVDRRYQLNRVTADSAYNVSDASGMQFLDATTNGGAPWGWQDVVNDLCNTLGLDESEFTLPFTPDGNPENLTYWGGSAWGALCDVLDRLACAPKLDHETDTFSVVRLGVDDPDFDAALVAMEKGRTFDGYPFDPERAWYPDTVDVWFLKRPRPCDGTSPYHVESISLASIPGQVPNTSTTLFDDLTATVDPDTGDVTNGANLATRANERATDWFRKRSVYELKLLKVYADFQPGVPEDMQGSEAGTVGFDDRGGAMRTELIARPDGKLEKWKPFHDLPPWYPADFCGDDCAGDAIYKDDCTDGFLKRYKADGCASGGKEPNWVLDKDFGIPCDETQSGSGGSGIGSGSGHPPPPEPQFPVQFNAVTGVCLPDCGFPQAGDVVIKPSSPAPASCWQKLGDVGDLASYSYYKLLTTPKLRIEKTTITVEAFGDQADPTCSDSDASCCAGQSGSGAGSGCCPCNDELQIVAFSAIGPMGLGCAICTITGNLGKDAKRPFVWEVASQKANCGPNNFIFDWEIYCEAGNWFAEGTIAPSVAPGTIQTPSHFKIPLTKNSGQLLGSITVPGCPGTLALSINDPCPGVAPCGNNSPIITSCCPGQGIPTLLHMTIVETLSCTCVNGTYAMNYNAGLAYWTSGLVDPCATGRPLEFRLSCDAINGWQLKILEAASSQTPFLSSVVCSPLQLKWNLVNINFVAGYLGACTSSANITITV